MKGQHLDLTDGPDDGRGTGERGLAGRRFVGIHFVCCDIYTRVYVNRDETAYVGRCPRCTKQVRLEIGPGGTDNRFFSAG